MHLQINLLSSSVGATRLGWKAAGGCKPRKAVRRFGQASPSCMGYLGRGKLWGDSEKMMMFWQCRSFTSLPLWCRWCGNTLSMSRSTTCSVIPRPMSSRASTRRRNSKSWRTSSGGFVTSSPSCPYCGLWLEKATESRRLLTPRSACSLGKVSSPVAGLAGSGAAVCVGEMCFCPRQPCYIWNSEGALLVQEIKLLHYYC